MDDFIFKVPKLPEDRLQNKRNPANCIWSKNENENENLDFRRESRNLSQASLFERNNRIRNHSELQPLREGIQEDLAQPSTSQCQKVIQFNGNKFFNDSLGRFGFDGFRGNNFNERHNNFVNATLGDNHRLSVCNSSNVPRISHSALGGRVFGNSINFSSSHNSHHSSVMRSCFKNSLHENSDMYRGMNSNSCFQLRQYTGVNNEMEPSCSSLSRRKSVFGANPLPRQSGIQRDFSTNESRSRFNGGINAFGCMTRESSKQESHIMLNTSQTVMDNQSVLKSVLQMSVAPMKEQIMNKLENLGHALLRNAPEMKAVFNQTAEDIKGIINNSIYNNPVMNNTAMTSLSFISGMIGCPQQSIIQGETNLQQCEPIKKPSSILQNLFKENTKPKYDIVKSCTIKRKKDKNLNFEDVSFEESTIIENVTTTTRKLEEKKELNLENWYPIVKKKGLAFVGMNDENVRIETEIVEKRVNNRRVMLENGIVCNLIGNPSTDKKFPVSISTKIKNGLHPRWRILTEVIEEFQKSTQKEIMDGDVSTTGFESSFNGTMTRNAAKSLKIVATNNRKLGGKKTDKSVPAKGGKVKGEADDPGKKHKSGGARNKIENNGKRRSPSPVEKLPVKIQKTDSTKIATVEEPGNEDRVLCTTRSGRTVKRPKDVWTGGSLDDGNTREKTRKTTEENTKEETNEGQPTESANVKKGKHERKTSNSTVNRKSEEIIESPVATKPRRKATKKVTTKPVLNGNNNTSGNDYSMMDDLDDILLPNISIHHEDIIPDPKKLKLLTMETPPLKYIRSNFTFLKNVTPVQSPDWHVSQHTRSAVKKFEKLRAQAFKKRIPKENATKKEKKVKNPVRSNKDVDAVVNWIGEREVRSPKKKSNLMKYFMPKRDELEDEEEDSGDEEEV